MLDTIGINVPAEAVTLALAGGGLVQFAVMHVVWLLVVVVDLDGVGVRGSVERVAALEVVTVVAARARMAVARLGVDNRALSLGISADG